MVMMDVLTVSQSTIRDEAKTKTKTKIQTKFSCKSMFLDL